jgi:hypothetical protein
VQARVERFAPIGLDVSYGGFQGSEDALVFSYADGLRIVPVNIGLQQAGLWNDSGDL